MTAKYINNKSEIGVLVSRGWGAGWSTWHDYNDRDFFSMDKTLVEMCLQEAKTEEVEAYLTSKDKDVYMGGWEDCRVTFLPPNTAFRINEFDGNETLWTIQDLRQNTGE